jgi:hypothetical protein
MAIVGKPGYPKMRSGTGSSDLTASAAFKASTGEPGGSAARPGRRPGNDPADAPPCVGPRHPGGRSPPYPSLHRRRRCRPPGRSPLCWPAQGTLNVPAGLQGPGQFGGRPDSATQRTSGVV